MVCRGPVPDIASPSCFHLLMILYDFAQKREHREHRENHENHEIMICDFYDFQNFQNMSRTGPQHEKVVTLKVLRTGPTVVWLRVFRICASVCSGHPVHNKVVVEGAN